MSDATFPQAQGISDPPPPQRKKNVVGWIVMLVILLGGSLLGINAYRKSLTREVTDNAQISGNILPVSARVRGHVAEVMFGDNDLVKKGQLLFTLDSSVYSTRLEQAQSALDSARNRLAQSKLQLVLTEASTSAQVEKRTSSVDVSRQQVNAAGQSIEVAKAEAERTASDIASAQAKIAQADAEVKRAQAETGKAAAEAKRLADDRQRYRELLDKREVSQQQYEASASAAVQAEAQVEVARQQVNAAMALASSAQAALDNAQAGRQVALRNIAKAESNRGAMQASVGEAEGSLREAQATALQAGIARSAVEGFQSEVKRAEAALEQARLDVSYTKVLAPVDGRVAQKSIEPGQNLEAGVPALALVDESDVWVVANFKETQMEKVTVGLSATIHVDTYPNQPLQGQVESIQAGTGSIFSLLPPENASGSFVKVVQRIPVKITISPEERKKVPLRPGMSVEATVWLP